MSTSGGATEPEITRYIYPVRVHQNHRPPATDQCKGGGISYTYIDHILTCFSQVECQLSVHADYPRSDILCLPYEINAADVILWPIEMHELLGILKLQVVYQNQLHERCLVHINCTIVRKVIRKT